MPLDINGLIFSFAAYLLGSIPFGLLVSRLYGTPDPRLAGSGNIGFTNVLRLSGKKAGILTLLGDLGKGWIVGWVGVSFYSQTVWGLVGVLAVVAGHIFPIFLKFQGGKGVATAFGGILGIHFVVGVILVCIWLGAVGIWRYSSGGALMAFGTFPLVSWLVVGKEDFFVFSLLLSSAVLLKHKENIQRLLHGTEPRMGVR